jgi:hypothetical protein
MNFKKLMMIVFAVLAVGLLLFIFALFRKIDVPSPELSQQAEWAAPEISIDRETGMASMEISILTYNIAALPFPIACGKASRLTDEQGKRIPIACNRNKGITAIAKALANLRVQGVEPDVVLVQEAFLPAVAEIAGLAGYPNWVAGPGPEDTGPRYSERASESFIENRSFWKGEKWGKRQPSGLLVISDFQIVEHINFPFYEWECAGFDCLANKGVILARLRVPGLPDLLEVATAHYNAKGASGVPIARAHEAHRLQVDAALEFLLSTTNFDLPAIWGGDMNMRRSEDRISYFVEQTGDGLHEVSSYCIENPANCQVNINDKSDQPWFQTQDLQGWDDGSRVSIEPIRLEEIFDQPVDGKMLSDHSGFLVDYRLSWPIQATD